MAIIISVTGDDKPCILQFVTSTFLYPVHEGSRTVRNVTVKTLPTLYSL